jgi:hypothetical protein
VASLPEDREMRYDYSKRLAGSKSPEIIEEQRGHLEALLLQEPNNAALHYFLIQSAAVRFQNAVDHQTGASPATEFENLLQLMEKAPRKPHPDIPQDLNWDRWVLVQYDAWVRYRESLPEEVQSKPDPSSFAKEELEIWQGAHARWPRNEPILRELYHAYQR